MRSPSEQEREGFHVPRSSGSRRLQTAPPRQLTDRHQRHEQYLRFGLRGYCRSMAGSLPLWTRDTNQFHSAWLKRTMLPSLTDPHEPSNFLRARQRRSQQEFVNSRNILIMNGIV
jgi:hypothetical protein